MILKTRTYQWADEAACAATAASLAHACSQQNLIIELHGTLGAGKTTFARYFLQALGVTGRIKSPSYTVVESYDTGQQSLWHFDFYRFDDPQEWEDAGLRDIFAGPGIKLVEWPEKAAGLAPVADLIMQIDLGHPSTTRSVTLTARTEAAEKVLV